MDSGHTYIGLPTSAIDSGAVVSLKDLVFDAETLVGLESNIFLEH